MGKKGRDAESTGPHTHVWQLRSWRDISVENFPPDESQTHAGTPKEEHQGQDKKSA